MQTLQDALKSLKSAEADLLMQLKPIQDAIASIERNLNLNGSAAPYKQAVVKADYNDKWPLNTKFLYLLKTVRRFMTFREAGDLIAQIEGKGDGKEIGAKLSNSTAQLKKDGTITKYQAGKSNQDTFWGSPKWLNEDGSIKPGHEINEEYLYEGAKKTPLFDI